MKSIICKTCGASFPYDGTHSKKKYCSHRCAAMAPRPKTKTGKILSCYTCGKSFYRPNCKSKSKYHLFCSRECVGRWLSISKSGAGNSNFTGGSLPWEYYGRNWRKQSNKARIRDCNKCKICGKTYDSMLLDVHHIKPYKSFTKSKQANSLSNLITLCKKCHALMEKQSRKDSHPVTNLIPFVSL